MPEDLREIKTGVDRLVGIIKKGSISVSEASKLLKVHRDVVIDWANLLEEENVISIDYSLSKTILKPNIDKIETKEKKPKKHKIFTHIKSMLTKIEKEEEDLVSFKDELSSIKGIVDDDMTILQKELNALGSTEKSNMQTTNKIHHSRRKYKDQLRTLNSKLTNEQKKYQSLLTDINTEKKQLQSEKSQVLTIKSEEAKLKKNLRAMTTLIIALDSKVKEEDKQVNQSDKHIQAVQKMANDVKSQILKDKDQINELIVLGEKQKKELNDAENKLIARIAKIENIKGKSSKQVTKQIKQLFAKKKMMKKLVATIENDRLFLEDHLRELIKKASAINMKNSGKEYQKQLKDLETHLKTINRKKEQFKKEIVSLHNIC